MLFRHWIMNYYLEVLLVRGVLGNKCVWQPKKKRYKLGRLCGNKIYIKCLYAHKSFWELTNKMSCLDSSAYARWALVATPYSQTFVSWILNFLVNLRKNLPRTPYETLKHGKWSIFLSEYLLFTCKNYPPLPPSLPLKNCCKNREISLWQL